MIEESDNDNLFLTFDWIDCWLDFMPSDCTLFIILVYKEDNLIAIAPFYKAPIKILKFIPARVIRVLADQNSSAEYQDLIVRGNHIIEATEAIAREIKGSADDCLGAWIPYSDDSVGASGRLETLFRKVNYTITSRAIAFFQLPLPADYETYESNLSAKQRSNNRRYRKQLSEQQSLTLENLQDLMSPDEIFAVLEELHSKRWLAQGEEGAFKRNPKFKEFLKAYTSRAITRNQVAAFCLFQGKKPIAIRFGFKYNNTLYEIQSGFDPSYNGAGITVIDMSIKAAILEQTHTYDFLAFEGDYKQRFGAKEKPGKRFFCVRKNLLGQLISQFGLWPTGRYIQL